VSSRSTAIECSALRRRRGPRPRGNEPTDRMAGHRPRRDRIGSAPRDNAGYQLSLILIRANLRPLPTDKCTPRGQDRGGSTFASSTASSGRRSGRPLRIARRKEGDEARVPCRHGRAGLRHRTDPACSVKPYCVTSASGTAVLVEEAAETISTLDRAGHYQHHVSGVVGGRWPSPWWGRT
jgi:hypothetical protein